MEYNEGTDRLVGLLKMKWAIGGNSKTGKSMKDAKKAVMSQYEVPLAEKVLDVYIYVYIDT